VRSVSLASDRATAGMQLRAPGFRLPQSGKPALGQTSDCSTEMLCCEVEESRLPNWPESDLLWRQAAWQPSKGCSAGIKAMRAPLLF